MYKRQEHKTIRFDTLTKRGEYEIVAVFKTIAYSSAGFRYYDFVDAEDENDFNAYIAKCKELALYDTGVTAEYGDRLITLSTCEYSAQNGRLVVVDVYKRQPFALMGFVKYNGMNAEQFVWAWVKSEFLMPKKLMFQPDNLYYETLKATIQNHEKEALKNNA